MSGRKRKSLWDCKEETEVPSEFSTHNARYGQGTHSNHRAQRSDLEATNALNSNSCPRRSSSQTWQDNNEHRDFNEIPETARIISGGKGYSQSPVFNGHGRQNHSPSQETSWGQSHRYQRSRSSSRSRGRARSRSRDRDMDEDKDYTRRRDRDVDEDRDYTRSRDRDMDEDREYNQSRDRDMDEDRDYARSRGRGRDIDDDSDYPRSWERERNKDMDEDRNFTRSRGGRDRDINNDSARSRSTLYDHRRLDGTGDRKSGSRVPSQLCRDFAVGNCRRGSQCRFLHEDDLKLRDGGELAERAEKWRGRQEAGEALSADIERLRYHPANKVSNYDRSNRSTSFDHDHMRRPNQPYKKGNIPCKYFAIGRCHRDDCRFSHDQSEGGSVEGRLHYDRYARHMGNENKYRNGPEWGDGNVVPNVNITKWSDNDVRTVNYTDRITAKKQTYDSSDQNMNHENKSWNGPGWGDVNGVSDLASARWVENNAGSVDFSEAAVVEIKTDERHGNKLDFMMQNTTENGSNIADVETFELTGAASSFGREVRHNSQGSHFRLQNGMSLQTYEHIIDRAPTQQLTGNVGHPVVSGSFDVQQHNNKGGNNDMLADDSNAVNGVSISGSTMHLGIPDQRFGQKTESLGSLLFSSADTTQKNTIPLNPSRGYGIDPNGSDKQSLYLSPQNEPTIFSEESTKKQQVYEFEKPQADSGIHQSHHQNDMTSYQVTEMTNLSASLNEILSKGQQLPELYAALNPNNSSRLLSSLSSSAIVSSPIGSTAGQHNPTTMFKEQYVHIGDTVEPSKYNKRGKPDYLTSVLPSSTEDPSKHDSNSKPYELDKSMTSEHLLLLSNDGISEHGNNNKPDELHEPEQMKPITNSESQENYSMQGEKCKPEDEIHLANPEGEVRDGICVKDEKEMRLFKVALVEYVKDILKPTWKEGHMSREVHKTIVKKVVDKVTSTIQGGHVPKTQEKIDQYLACSKGKLTKLVQAYTERLSKS